MLLLLLLFANLMFNLDRETWQWNGWYYYPKFLERCDQVLTISKAISVLVITMIWATHIKGKSLVSKTSLVGNLEHFGKYHRHWRFFRSWRPVHYVEGLRQGFLRNALFVYVLSFSPDNKLTQSWPHPSTKFWSKLAPWVVSRFVSWPYSVFSVLREACKLFLWRSSLQSRPGTVWPTVPCVTSQEYSTPARRITNTGVTRGFPEMSGGLRTRTRPLWQRWSALGSHSVQCSVYIFFLFILLLWFVSLFLSFFLSLFHNTFFIVCSFVPSSFISSFSFAIPFCLFTFNLSSFRSFSPWFFAYTFLVSSFFSPLSIFFSFVSTTVSCAQ